MQTIREAVALFVEKHEQVINLVAAQHVLRRDPPNLPDENSDDHDTEEDRPPPPPKVRHRPPALNKLRVRV